MRAKRDVCLGQRFLYSGGAAGWQPEILPIDVDDHLLGRASLQEETNSNESNGGKHANNEAKKNKPASLPSPTAHAALPSGHVRRLDLALSLAFRADTFNDVPSAWLVWVWPPLVDLAGAVAAIAAQAAATPHPAQDEKQDNHRADQENSREFHSTTSPSQIVKLRTGSMIPSLQEDVKGILWLANAVLALTSAPLSYILSALRLCTQGEPKQVAESAGGVQAAHGEGIAWREWGAETFRLAQEMDRPVLLDISAVWCHWCHVMDQTSYADPGVIDLINRYYVAVRVDNDRRPDINERYNMGGWPTTAFLTPSGDTLTGGTYIPPDQMRRLLVQVSDYYRRSKQDIHNRIAALQQVEKAPAAASHSALDTSIVSNVAQSVLDAFDAEYGGFGDEPKFPHPDALELALRQYQRSQDKAFLTIATLTLDKMALGGIYDPVEGGFFRYSTTRDWSIPHFEKMLEGNAGLLANSLRVFQVTGEQRYAGLASDVMRYLDTVLSDRQQGGFYGSQDADEEYYALFHAERQARPAPFVDRTLYVDWNAQMASAYLLAAGVLADGRPQEFALRTLDRLWQVCWSEGSGMGHYYEGQPHLPGLLADQVYMGMALLDAYKATGDWRCIDQAEGLAAFCLAALADAGGGFADSVEQADAVGNLRSRLVSLPSNVVAARFLLRLSWLTDNEAYGAAARGALARFSGSYERLGYFAAPYALAVDEVLRPPLKIVVVGDTRDARTAALHSAARRLSEPWKVIQVLDPQRDRTAFARSGFPVPSQPLAYPCVGATCLAPLSDPAALTAWGRDIQRNT